MANNSGVSLASSYILNKPISINLCISTSLWLLLSPSAGTWHLFDSAYSLSISLIGLPTWLYLAKPLAKTASLLTDSNKTYSRHTEGNLTSGTKFIPFFLDLPSKTKWHFGEFSGAVFRLSCMQPSFLQLLHSVQALKFYLTALALSILVYRQKYSSCSIRFERELQFEHTRLARTAT